MKWTVVWNPNASNQLADIWLRAVDRNAVASATAEIERAIAQDPENAGFEYYGDRLYVVLPISAVYEISPPDRLVRVIDVFYRGPQREP